MPFGHDEIDFLEIQALPIRLGINRRPRVLRFANLRIPAQWVQRALLFVKVGILVIQFLLLIDDRIPSKTPLILGLLALFLGMLESIFVLWDAHA